MRIRQLSAADIKKIIELYTVHRIGQKHIAKRYETTSVRIQKILREAGVTDGKRNPRND